MKPLVITVLGVPGPQGSKAFRGMRNGKPILSEMSKKVKPWREAIMLAVLEQDPNNDPISFRGAVEVEIVFTMVRPKKSKRDAVPAVSPDLDKLLRSTFDALTKAGVWEDDSRVVRVVAEKCYPANKLDRIQSLYALDQPGAVIIVKSLGVQ